MDKPRHLQNQQSPEKPKTKDFVTGQGFTKRDLPPEPENSKQHSQEQNQETWKTDVKTYIRDNQEHFKVVAEKQKVPFKIYSQALEHYMINHPENFRYHRENKLRDNIRGGMDPEQQKIYNAAQEIYQDRANSAFGLTWEQAWQRAQQEHNQQQPTTLQESSAGASFQTPVEQRPNPYFLPNTTINFGQTDSVPDNPFAPTIQSQSSQHEIFSSNPPESSLLLPARSPQERLNIADAYILAGNHRSLPLVYREAIGRQPFTKGDLTAIRSRFSTAVENNQLSKEKQEKLSKIIQQQSEAGKAKKAQYNQSEDGKKKIAQHYQNDEVKKKRVQRNQSEAGKAKKAQYRQREDVKEKTAQYNKREDVKEKKAQYDQSEAGKERMARHLKKATDAQVLNIRGVEILDEENFE